MSRPKTSEPRCRQLNLSLTERELVRIEARARAVGMRPVHFGRAILLDDSRAMPGAATAESGNAARLIYLQLVRLGNNLNQMMRYLHRTGGAIPTDLAPLLSDIRHLIAKGPE